MLRSSGVPINTRSLHLEPKASSITATTQSDYSSTRGDMTTGEASYQLDTDPWGSCAVFPPPSPVLVLPSLWMLLTLCTDFKNLHNAEKHDSKCFKSNYCSSALRSKFSFVPSHSLSPSPGLFSLWQEVRSLFSIESTSPRLRHGIPPPKGGNDGFR